MDPRGGRREEAQPTDDALGPAQGIVRRLRFLSPTTAWVYLAVHLGPGTSGFPFEGPVRLTDGSWKVTRELQTKMLGAAGVELPPKS